MIFSSPFFSHSEPRIIGKVLASLNNRKQETEHNFFFFLREIQFFFATCVSHPVPRATSKSKRASREVK